MRASTSDSFSSGKTTVGQDAHVSKMSPLHVPHRPQSPRPRALGWVQATHVCPRAPQVYDLGAAVPVLLQPRALEAVEGVRDALAAAHDALVLVVPEAALVADAHQGRGPHVRVADGALAVALVAEPADGDAGLLAAHYEVGVMARHGEDVVVVVMWNRV